MVFMRDLTAAEILSVGASATATEAAMDWACGEGREVRRVSGTPGGRIVLDVSVDGRPPGSYEFTPGGSLMRLLTD
jgi:hypothetical protein